MASYRELTMTRAEWLDFRRSHVGGSDAAAVMGIPGAFRTAYQVWAEKRGMVEPEDISDVPRVEWGTRLEHDIAVKWSQCHPDALVSLPEDPSTFRVLVPEDRPWAMATLDGVVSDGDGLSVLEIKTAHYPGSREWGPTGSGAKGVPAKYLAQVNHYLSVTGWDRAHVAVLVDGYDYREYVVEADPEDIAAVTEAVDGFWRVNVEQGVAPATFAADSSTLAAAHPEGGGGYAEGDALALELVEEWREARGRARTARKEADDLEVRLKSLIGDRDGLEFDEGRLTWERTTSTRLDTRALKSEEPDVYERFLRETARQQLRWKGAE